MEIKESSQCVFSVIINNKYIGEFMSLISMCAACFANFHSVGSLCLKKSQEVKVCFPLFVYIKHYNHNQHMSDDEIINLPSIL